MKKHSLFIPEYVTENIYTITPFLLAARGYRGVVFDLDNTSCSKWTRKFLAEAQRAGAIVEATDELPKSFLVVSEYGENRVILTKYNAAVLLKRMQDAQRSPISAKGEAI